MRNLLLLILFSLAGISCTSPSKVHVLKISKAIYTGVASDPLASSCDTWQLSKKNIINVLSLSKSITGPELHYEFYHLPCEITGQLTIAGELFNFTVNAASYITLEKSKKVEIKGCKHKQCKAFFLMEPERQDSAKK